MQQNNDFLHDVTINVTVDLPSKNVTLNFITGSKMVHKHLEGGRFGSLRPVLTLLLLFKMVII